MSLQMPCQLSRRRCIPPPPPRFGDDLAHRLDLAVNSGEAILERECVEQHEAADAPRGGAIPLLVGGGDDFGHSMRSARVPTERLRGLIEGVVDGGGGRDHAVDALNFEREKTQLVGESIQPAAARGRLCVDVGSRAVQVPLQIVGLLEGVADLGFVSEAVGVEGRRRAQRRRGLLRRARRVGLAERRARCSICIRSRRDRRCGVQSGYPAHCHGVAARRGRGCRGRGAVRRG